MFTDNQRSIITLCLLILQLQLLLLPPPRLPLPLLLPFLHPFNGLFSTTTCVSRYQKGKTTLDLNEARDDGVLGWLWHQLDHMQTVCTSLQTDNHANTTSLNFLGRMLFLTPHKQCQSTEGTLNLYSELILLIYRSISWISKD